MKKGMKKASPMAQWEKSSMDKKIDKMGAEMMMKKPVPKKGKK